MKALQKNRLFHHGRTLMLFMALLLSVFFCTLTVSAGDPKPTAVSASKKSITVTAGKEFELKVKTRPLDAEDDYLKWKIVSGSQYVRFSDSDRTGDDMEFHAIKAGTAVVRCQIKNTRKKVDFTIKVKASSKKIKASGSLTKTVPCGEDFDLEVKKYAGLKDRYLKWTIKDTSVVGFDDDERTGDDVEFLAKKPGTTKITCKNTKTGQKITFTIKVI